MQIGMVDVSDNAEKLLRSLCAGFTFVKLEVETIEKLTLKNKIIFIDSSSDLAFELSSEINSISYVYKFSDEAYAFCGFVVYINDCLVLLGELKDSKMQQDIYDLLRLQASRVDNKLVFKEYFTLFAINKERLLKLKINASFLIECSESNEHIEIVIKYHIKNRETTFKFIRNLYKQFGIFIFTNERLSIMNAMVQLLKKHNFSLYMEDCATNGNFSKSFFEANGAGVIINSDMQTMKHLSPTVTQAFLEYAHKTSNENFELRKRKHKAPLKELNNELNTLSSLDLSEEELEFIWQYKLNNYLQEQTNISKPIVIGVTSFRKQEYCIFIRAGIISQALVLHTKDVNITTVCDILCDIIRRIVLGIDLSYESYKTNNFVLQQFQ